MNYELAKQLKDAGFPQTDFGGFNFQEDINYPTLSELIKACGEHFTSLWKVKDGWEANCVNVMSEINSEPVNVTRGRSQTPEEAVANLWLELNKQHER